MVISGLTMKSKPRDGVSLGATGAAHIEVQG
jgi:hypothetical protein